LKAYLFKLPLFTSFLIFSFSCSQVEYSRTGGQANEVSHEESDQDPQIENLVPLEKPKYKVVYRKSNLEALSIGRNRIEIQELMGEPDGKSLDGGNGYLWDYRRPVFDEVSDETYGWSLISFKFLKGLCAYVNIRLEQPPLELLQEKKPNKLFNFKNFFKN
jgi:hypothetical protein